MKQEGLSYSIKFSRRRSIGIIVSPRDGVVVRAPYRTPVSVINSFVESRSEWIRKHLESYTNMKSLSNGTPGNGQTIMFRGREYLLKIINGRYNRVIAGDDEIFISIKEGEESSKAGKLLAEWYRKKAVEEITIRFNEIVKSYENYDFRPASLNIRIMKRRWGSCSSKGRITLNSELIKLDQGYLDYVILHELCHLKHHNHGTGFYSLLSDVCPGWKEKRRGLRQYLT